MIKSRVWKFENDIDTDQIIPSQYLILPQIDDMKKHVFETLDAKFADKVKAGDIIIAGENFGCGSSREQAPSALKALGVYAIVASSFARIFYRNAINIGLPVILCSSIQNDINNEDEIELDLESGIIKFKQKVYECTKLPLHMQRIINRGGLIAFLNDEEE